MQTTYVLFNGVLVTLQEYKEMIAEQPSIKAYDLLDPYYGKVSQEVWEHANTLIQLRLRQG